MERIKDIKKYPKFLRCNALPQSWSWNKHLPKPWVSGELVRVADASEQHSSPYVGTEDKLFRRQYVVVYRKDGNGKFTHRCTGEWKQFELLTK